MKNASNEMFGPQTDFSRNMLASIPRKVMTWLSTLGKFESTGHYGDLNWMYLNIDEATSSIMIDGETPIEILWNGKNEDPQMLRGSEAWFEHIEQNLDRFVELEQRIYGEIEELQKEVLAEAEALDPMNNLEEYAKKYFFEALKKKSE